MNLDNNNHSVFSLFYQLVLVIKYRRNVINDVSNRLKEIFEYISPGHHITLQEWNHDRDHVHVCSKRIRTPKYPSSLMPTSLIKKEFPDIRKSLWQEFLVKKLLSIDEGDAPIEVIRAYIETKGKSG